MIYFSGHRISKKQQKNILRAAELALEYLCPRLWMSLVIEFHIIYKLIEKENRHGDVVCLEDRRYPKFFDVRLNWTGVKDLELTLSTVCHEMIHVAQYGQNRLRQMSESYKVGWEKDHYYTNQMDYLEQPWEKEAYEREDEVYEHVRAEMKNRYYITLREVTCPPIH